MSKNLEYNVNVNASDNIEPSINRLRELRKEIRNATAGSEDFRKLRAEMDDIEDSLKTAKTGAGNFADVLGTIPGPIGAIGSQAANTIDTLKSFSKFNLKDLKSSFSELGADLTSAASGLGKLTGITKAYTVLNNFLAASFTKVGVAEGVAATGAKIFTAALISTGIGALVVLLGTAIGALYSFATGTDEAEAATAAFNAELEKTNEALANQTDALNRAQQRQIADLKAAGASERAIRNAQANQIKEDIQQNGKAENEARRLLRQAYQIEDDDARKEAVEKAKGEFKKANKTRLDSETELYVKIRENRAADNKDAQDAAEKAKAAAEKEAADREKASGDAIAKQKEYRDKRIAISEEIARAEIDLNARFFEEGYSTRRTFLEETEAQDQKALKQKLKKGELIQSEYDKKKKQLEEKLYFDLGDLEREYNKKSEEASKEILAMKADTLKEKEALEITAEQDRLDLLEIALGTESQIYEDQERAKLDFQRKSMKEGAETEKWYQESIKEIQAEGQKKINQRIADLATEGEENKAAITKKYTDLANKEADDALNKKLEDTNYTRSLELAQLELALMDEQKLNEDHQRTALGRLLKGHDDKRVAQAQFNKEFLGAEIDTLNAQLAELKTANFKTEEEKKALALKIIDIEKQIRDKTKEVDDQIQQDKEDSNLLSLEKIGGYLQAAAALVNAFADFQKMQQQLDVQATNEKWNAIEEREYLAYKAQIENESLSAEAKATIKADYEAASSEGAYQRALEEYNQGKAGFENSKTVQIAQAVIAGIQGAIQSYTSLAGIPIVGPVLGAIAAAAAAASSAIQINLIKKTNYAGKKPLPPINAKKEAATSGGGGSVSAASKFAYGGLLTGPQHNEGGIDTEFGQLEGGEFVVNRSATAAFLPLLDKINSMGSGSGALNNLSSSAESAIAQSNQQQIIKTYVVASEMASQLEAEKRISDIARL
jgi:limonene-1,2-epoxide hydrolase